MTDAHNVTADELAEFETTEELYLQAVGMA